MLITLKHKVVEKFVKTCFMVKNTHLLNGHMLKVHIGIASMRQFQCVPTTYVTEILKYTLNKYQIHWLSFKRLKLPISFKMANCLYLHGSYATKFDFMNYAFAKLIVAW